MEEVEENSMKVGEDIIQILEWSLKKTLTIFIKTNTLLNREFNI